MVEIMVRAYKNALEFSKGKAYTGVYVAHVSNVKHLETVVNEEKPLRLRYFHGIKELNYKQAYTMLSKS